MKGRLISKLISNQKGSVALNFALAAVGLIIAAGGSVDAWRKGAELAKLQAAVDVAALAAASSIGTQATKRTAAKESFRKNFTSKLSNVKETVSFDNDGTVVMSAAGTIQTYFLGVIGKDTLNIAATAEVKSINKDIELALVLDVSGSMRAGMGSGSRLDTLKSSAHKLLDKLDSGVGSKNSVKTGIVPFNMNVNIGTSNAKYVTGTNHSLFAGSSWAGCVMERAAPYTNTLDYNGNDTSAAGKWQAYVSPPTPNSQSAGYCINPSNGTNTGYKSITNNPPGTYTVQTPGPNYNCVRHPLLPVTNNISKVRAKIDSLTAESNMGTIIAPGVAWANRLLTPSAPFTEADHPRDSLHKIMVVLTDGSQTTEGPGNNLGCQNQQNSNTAFSYNPAAFKLDGRKLTQYGPKDQFSPYGFILDSDPFGTNPTTWNDVEKDLSNVSLDACNQAKQNGVEIFTIAVSNSAGPGTAVNDLLKSCATDVEHFFQANDAAALEAVFDAIGERVLRIHLSK